jgi:hypothetical protein
MGSITGTIHQKDYLLLPASSSLHSQREDERGLIPRVLVLFPKRQKRKQIAICLSAFIRVRPRHDPFVRYM